MSAVATRRSIQVAASLKLPVARALRTSPAVGMTRRSSAAMHPFSRLCQRRWRPPRHRRCPLPRLPDLLPRLHIPIHRPSPYRLVAQVALCKAAWTCARATRPMPIRTACARVSIGAARRPRMTVGCTTLQGPPTTRRSRHAVPGAVLTPKAGFRSAHGRGAGHVRSATTTPDASHGARITPADGHSSAPSTGAMAAACAAPAARRRRHR